MDLLFQMANLRSILTIFLIIYVRIKVGVSEQELPQSWNPLFEKYSMKLLGNQGIFLSTNPQNTYFADSILFVEIVFESIRLDLQKVQTQGMNCFGRQIQNLLYKFKSFRILGFYEGTDSEYSISWAQPKWNEQVFYLSPEMDIDNTNYLPLLNCPCHELNQTFQRIEQELNSRNLTLSIPFDSGLYFQLKVVEHLIHGAVLDLDRENGYSKYGLKLYTKPKTTQLVGVDFMEFYYPPLHNFTETDPNGIMCFSELKTKSTHSDSRLLGLETAKLVYYPINEILVSSDCAQPYFFGYSSSQRLYFCPKRPIPTNSGSEYGRMEVNDCLTAISQKRSIEGIEEKCKSSCHHYRPPTLQGQGPPKVEIWPKPEVIIAKDNLYISKLFEKVRRSCSDERMDGLISPPSNGAIRMKTPCNCEFTYLGIPFYRTVHAKSCTKNSSRSLDIYQVYPSTFIGNLIERNYTLDSLDSEVFYRINLTGETVAHDHGKSILEQLKEMEEEKKKGSRLEYFDTLAYYSTIFTLTTGLLSYVFGRVSGFLRQAQQVHVVQVYLIPPKKRRRA